MEDFPHKELTYKINGLIFDVYKELGFGYQEKYYQRAFEETLKKEKIIKRNYKSLLGLTVEL